MGCLARRAHRLTLFTRTDADSVLDSGGEGMRLAGVTTLVVSLLIVICGCAGTEEPTPSTGSGSGSSHSGTPEATEPAAPRDYADGNLEEALPTRRQIDGFIFTQQCRSFAKRCGPDEAPESLVITAYELSDGRGDFRSLAVRKGMNELWSAQRECVDGNYSKKLKDLGNGRYSPGERGRAKAFEFGRGDWMGVGCDRRLRYRYRDGSLSEPTRTTHVYVGNGSYVVAALAADRRRAVALLNDYLDRLDGGRS